MSLRWLIRAFAFAFAVVGLVVTSTTVYGENIAIKKLAIKNLATKALALSRPDLVCTLTAIEADGYASIADKNGKTISLKGYPIPRVCAVYSVKKIGPNEASPSKAHVYMKCYGRPQLTETFDVPKLASGASFTLPKVCQQVSVQDGKSPYNSVLTSAVADQPKTVKETSETNNKSKSFSCKIKLY